MGAKYHYSAKQSLLLAYTESQKVQVKIDQNSLGQYIIITNFQWLF